MQTCSTPSLRSLHSAHFGLLLSFVSFSLLALESPPPPAQSYTSPYSVQFTYPRSELIADLLDGSRGDPKAESSFDFDKWNSKEILAKYGVWGPPAKHYAVPENLAGKSVAWKRERIIATALTFQGISYQHHHIPAWNPPADWPWKKVSHGQNAPGVDCSNFSSFVYNLAFGIRLNSDVKIQSALTHAILADGSQVPLKRINKPATYADFIRDIRPGDLLFIRNNQDEISHVILWVGPLSRAPNNTPLIIDSTGGGHTDSNGTPIPDGVNLRPFETKSWYYKSCSHILRVFNDE